MPARAKQPALAVLDEAGSVEAGAQRFGERVVARHRMLLAAFLVRPDCPSGAARLEVLALHLQRRGDAREAVGSVAISARSALSAIDEHRNFRVREHFDRLAAQDHR